MKFRARNQNSAKESQNLLALKVTVVMAKNLGLSDNTVIHDLYSTVQFNDQIGTTKRVKCYQDPQWDNSVTLKLRKTCLSSCLTIACWDKDENEGPCYLGEARVNLVQVFENAIKTEAGKDRKNAVIKIEPKWLKLYSAQDQKSFVTGTVKVGFQLYGKERKKISKILNKSAPKPSEKPEKQERSSASPEISGPGETEVVVVENSLQSNELVNKWNTWVSGLKFKETIQPNEQNYYSMNDINKTYDVELDIPIPEIVKTDHLNTQNLSLAASDGAKEAASPKPENANIASPDFSFFSSPDIDYDSEFSELSDASSVISDTSVASGSVSSPTSNVALNALGSSKYSSNLTVPQSHLKVKKKKKIQKLKNDHYQLSISRNVEGVVFIEIISATGLPPFKNVMRSGFDMDPFVVVSFGKRTFRTSYRKHTLNPVFNERLAFEVLKNESNFDINFSVLDKDSITFHDKVADISINAKDVIDMSLNFLNPESSDSAESFLSSQDNVSSRMMSSSDSLNRKTLRSGILRKKIKPVKTLTPEKEEQFVKYDLPLKLKDESKYKDYSPVLSVKIRFTPYNTLRRDFWKRLLKTYDFDGDNNFSQLELSAFLDVLGSTLSQDTISQMFKTCQKNPETDSLSVDEVVESLESLIERKLNSNSSIAGQIIKIETCPVCGKRKLSKSEDIDIITHVAICASNDWSSVERILKSSFVTGDYMTKRWYSKAILKLGYGKMGMGSNNANILVQDRVTGIVLQEKMSVYVRIGIRILYRGSNAIQRKQAKRLLKKLTIRQGVYYDSHKSVKDIESFIKFHNLDMSECLYPIDKFVTFNDFFFRKLKPGSRPVEGADNPEIVTSAADCRCTAFNTVTSATKIWVKGNGFTVSKLFAGKYPEICKKFTTNCSICIFRLAPQDYHRFHSPVDGKVLKPEFIDGEYYTVNPMAIRSHLDVFGENVRCILPIETTVFGTVVVIPVGAMMVGSTVLTVKEGQEISRGDELGYFKFGGSTLLLLFQENRVNFDSDIVENSNMGIETLVKVGMSVGHSLNTSELPHEKREFQNEPEETKLKIIRTITGGANTGSLLPWEVTNLKLTDW